MKIKIGTQLDDEVFHQLKRRAAEERLPLNEVIQAALVDYLQQPTRRTSSKSGLARLLGRPPLKVTPKQFREIMDLDYWDQ